MLTIKKRVDGYVADVEDVEILAVGACARLDSSLLHPKSKRKKSGMRRVSFRLTIEVEDDKEMDKGERIRRNPRRRESTQEG